jgi:hypothetical protein
LRECCKGVNVPPTKKRQRGDTMARCIRYLAIMASVFVTVWFASEPALACACCSNRAARYVGVETLSGFRLDEIERMAFAAEAFLADGADDHPAGIRELGTTLKLAVTQAKSQIVFSFRGDADRAASLTLAIPETISIFEVDPRDGKDEGLGPVLYKEWQLTGDATATGALQPLLEKSRTVSLILHGRGRGCTEAADFTAWTLVMGGPSGGLTLYGALASTR